jgi:FlaA1/EpsC-like NDP-sugar epimerase
LNTVTIFNSAQKAGCELFALTSSICAERPMNFAHAALRLGEHYLLSSQYNLKTKPAIVRLFNLAENKGSFLATIQDQLQSGRKIFLNHPLEQRYFMTSSSAAKMMLYVLTEKLLNNLNGESVFIPFFNEPVKIAEITKYILKEIYDVKDIENLIEYIYTEMREDFIEESGIYHKHAKKTENKKIKCICPINIFENARVDSEILEFNKLIDRNDKYNVIKKVDQVLKSITEIENSIDLKNLNVANY